MFKVWGSFLVAASTLFITSGAFAQDYCPASTDLTGDGVTDAQDVDVLQYALGSVEGDANWVPAADFNGDGTVSVGDFKVMMDCN